MYLTTLVIEAWSCDLLLPHVCNKLFLSPPLLNKLRQLLSCCPRFPPPPLLPLLLAGSRYSTWHIILDMYRSGGDGELSFLTSDYQHCLFFNLGVWPFIGPLWLALPAR